MPNELKIIIDAEIQPAETKIKSFGKTVVGEFNKINSSANSLSSDITSSVNKINSSLSSLKVTSLDISINTSGIDAGIKSIQSKFSALTNPEVNVLANTELAEAKIKELLTELQTLKGSEIFIRANDTQALQKINEIEKELNSLVGKQINLSVAADLSKIQQLQEKINSLKVTPVNVVINTSSLDAQIKNIQSKFATLVDPKINVLANTTQAETVVKELLSELKALKGSEIFIKANDVQALKVIEGVEAELNTLLDKQIKLNVNATDATAKLALLEKELADLQTLTIQPDISTTQLAVFESNIKRIKTEIAALKGQAIVVPITADTKSILKAKTDLDSLIGRSIRVDVDATAALQKVGTLKTQLATISNVPFKFNTNTAIVSISKLQNEVQDLQNSLKTTTGLNSFYAALGKSTAAVGALSAKAAGLNNFFNQVTTSSTKAANALSRFPNTSNAATQSLFNLSRVAQDAPFGFLGIANNINPLVESFQRLKVSAKETGTSVKSALVGALSGPAGIGLAVGVASSLILSFGDDLLKLITPSKALSDALDAAAEGLTKNVGQVTVYVEALKSGTLTTEQTKKVQKELIDQAPEFQSAFKGNAVNVEELDRILATKYIPQLVKSIKVTAAFGIVNEKLAKSIRQIAKGGDDFSFGQKLETFFSGFGGIGASLQKGVDNALGNIKSAQEDLKTENISKLIEDTFKSLGITFGDAANTITDGGKKIGKAIGSLKDDTLSRARQFVKEFGDTFVLPDLTETFFKGAKELLPTAKKLLDDVAKGNLQIKIPIETELIQVKTTEEIFDKFTDQFKTVTKIVNVRVPIVTEFDFLPEIDALNPALGAKLSQEAADRFFKDAKAKAEIVITPVFSIAPAQTKEFDELEKQFARFGEVGIQAFTDISFGSKDGTNQVQAFNDGLLAAYNALRKLQATAGRKLNFEAAIESAQKFTGIFDFAGNKVFKDLSDSAKESALLINETLTPAFQNMFDAIVQGKNPLKAFFDSIVQSINQVIKKLIAAAVQAAILSAITGGGSNFGKTFLKILGVAGGTLNPGNNFNLGGAIGSRAFNNVIQIVGDSRLSGNDIVTSYRRTTNTNGRGG